MRVLSDQSRWDCSHQQGECTQDSSVLDVQSRAVARSRSCTCWRALAGTGAYAQFATLAPTGQLWLCGRVAHPETFAVAVASRREQPRAVTVQSQAVASFAVAVVYRHELSLAVVLRPRAVLSSREQSRDVSSIRCRRRREWSRAVADIHARREPWNAFAARQSPSRAIASSRGQSRASRASQHFRGRRSRGQSRASQSQSRDVPCIR